MKIFIRLAASIVGSAALIAAIGALALHFWPGSQKVTLAAAAVSPVLFVATAVIALICLLTIRAWLRLVVAIAVAAAGIWVQSPLFTDDGPPVGQTLTVLNSNLQVGAADIDALAKLVRENRVDFLAIEELTPAAAQRIAASSIAADLPHSFVRPVEMADGTGLYSRYPLSSAASIPGFTLEGITAVATVPGRGEVQLFALHPVPPLQAETWERELKQIGSLLQGVPAGRPVIALGDYNSTYDHAQFRSLLTGGYRDAAEMVGAGWLPTYPTDKTYPPMVQIDHVLLRGLGAAAVTAHDVPGADHRAVLAKVG